jgi:hypothetical protein
MLEIGMLCCIATRLLSLLEAQRLFRSALRAHHAADLAVCDTVSPATVFLAAFNLKTAVNAGGFAQSFGRLRLALSAELPFLG